VKLQIDKDDRSDTEPETESDDGIATDGNGVEGNGIQFTSHNCTTTLANSIKAHSDEIVQRKNCVTRWPVSIEGTGSRADLLPQNKLGDKLTNHCDALYSIIEVIK